MGLTYFDRRDHRIYAEPYYMVNKFPIFFYTIDCFEIIKKVIDEKGNIMNFPGIKEDERIDKELRVRLFHDVRYEACFKKMNDNNYFMEWMIQPDGKYWMDEDGFGIEYDQSIILYSILDENGNFTKPFEVYSIGKVNYCDM